MGARRPIAVAAEVGVRNLRHRLVESRVVVRIVNRIVGRTARQGLPNHDAALHLIFLDAFQGAEPFPTGELFACEVGVPLACFAILALAAAAVVTEESNDPKDYHNGNDNACDKDSCGVGIVVG